MGAFTSQLGPAFTEILRITGSMRLTVVLLVGVLIYMMDGTDPEVKIVLAQSKPIALAILGAGFAISDALRKVKAPSLEKRDETTADPPAPAEPI